MAPNDADIIVDPQPSSHVVYTYASDTDLVDAVSLFAAAGLGKREGVVLLLTTRHSDAVRARLAGEGFKLKDLESTGQLVCRDASDLASAFVVDGVVDEFRFKQTIIHLIDRAKTGNDGQVRSVRVFGEIVDLLWKTDPLATERLEQLWNEVIEAESISLLCGYSLAGVQLGGFPTALLMCHSDRIG